MVNAELRKETANMGGFWTLLWGKNMIPGTHLTPLVLGGKKPEPRSLFRQVHAKNRVDVEESLRVSYKPVYAIYKGNNPT